MVDAIRRGFDVLRIKNRSIHQVTGERAVVEDRQKSGGYAGVRVDVTMPNGTIAEIQINVPEMLAAKEGANGDGPGHRLYEAQRDSKKGGEVWVGTDRACSASTARRSRL